MPPRSSKRESELVQIGPAKVQFGTVADMPRRSNAELVKAARHDIEEVRRLLVANDIEGAVAIARQGFKVARAQRSHQLLSEAWVSLLEALAALPGSAQDPEYDEVVEGAYAWAETMPEEIQTWFLLAIEPHLEAVGSIRHLDRARQLRERANAWLQRGGLSISTRVQSFQLDDLERGRPIDPRALALERSAAFYADEMFDPDGQYLAVAAEAWRQAGRPDRADFLLELVAELLQGR